MNLGNLTVLLNIFHRSWQSILVFALYLLISGYNAIRHDDVMAKLSLEEKISMVLWRGIDNTTVFNQEDVYSDGSIGVVFHDISVPSLIKSIEQLDLSSTNNQLLIAGNLNEINGVAPLPAIETIRNIQDSTIKKAYFEEIERRLRLLHLQMDISVSSLKGFSFVMLDSTRNSTITLKDAFNSANVMVAFNEYNDWKDKLIKLVKSGEIPRKLLNEKVRLALENRDRILQINHSHIDFKISQIENPLYLNHLLNGPDLVSLNLKFYQNSFSLLKNDDEVIPITDIKEKTQAILLLSNSSDLPLQNYLNKYLPGTAYCFENFDTGELEQKLLLYDRIFVQFENEVPGEVIQLLDGLLDQVEIFVSYLGSKNNLRLLDRFKVLFWHPEANIFTRNLAPQVFFGGLSIDNKKPQPTNENTFRLHYGTPEMAGMDSRTLDRIDQIVTLAIQDTTFPGCQVLVAKNGQVVYDRNFGYLTYQKQTPVTSNTIYDLASLTKVLATVPAIMNLESSGKIDLDIKLSYYLPELTGTNKNNIIIRDILVHQAGLYPYWPFWKQTIEKGKYAKEYYNSYQNNEYPYEIKPGLYAASTLPDSIWKWTLDTKMVKIDKPNESYPYVYSDFGFIMLQKLIEKNLDTPLDSFALQTLFKPLGMHQTTFLPDCVFPLNKIAPTELETVFRKSLIHGNVHDQTASLMGGVAGNAGLFSNATDLAKFMLMYIQEGYFGGQQYFKPGLTNQFTSEQYENNRRGLGWDKKDWEGEGNSSYYASKKAFGHTGFTGTSIWADPEFELIYVFLSNRVYPDAENFKLAENSIRTRIHDVIYESIWNYRKTHAEFK